MNNLAYISLSHPTRQIHGSIRIFGSKSESNRALIIRALSSDLIQIENLSNADDTTTLEAILSTIHPENNRQIIDVGHAGTGMRFLTAYLAISPGKYLLTGSDRMKHRPIKPLVDALRQAGANINYLGEVGFPPLDISGTYLDPETPIDIDASVSSQFVSALLLIAPKMKHGLNLTVSQNIASAPYIAMTLAMMDEAGVFIQKNNNLISIAQQQYKRKTLYIEADWSSASYWFSMAALSQDAEIELIGLKEYSKQGDRIIVDLMKSLGIVSKYTHQGLLLKKSRSTTEMELRFDFADCPDLAQTVLVCAAALGKNVVFTGVETLKIKETDRLSALSQELQKIGIKIEDHNNHYYLNASGLQFPDEVTFDTYEDHRMAMALAPLTLKCQRVIIRQPSVITKSYPTYWEDLKSVGFECNFI